MRVVKKRSVNRVDVPRLIPMQLVHQWLPDWGKCRTASAVGKGPPDGFFVFSMSAAELKALTGIQRRTAEGPRGADLAVQRRHDEARSKEIAVYLRLGLVLSSARDRHMTPQDHTTLKMPGWLPTAIIVNILSTDDRRNRDQRLHPRDAIEIKTVEGMPHLQLPTTFRGRDWKPHKDHLHPIEVIDGQHRLWAFDGDSAIPDDFELPVVAYRSLDLRWQAYLFWSINVKPKRISPSLAYDLYPILRNEEWLSAGTELQVYRDVRAQELVEALWRFPKSPFYRRVNMLGEPRQGDVTQAAWIRALTATFIRRYSGHGRIRIGGLFGADDSDAPHVPWSSAQQAAFLIALFDSLLQEMVASRPKWLILLTSFDDGSEPGLKEIFGRHSLLRQDQGIRSVLHVYNDLFVLAEGDLELASLFDRAVSEVEATYDRQIGIALEVIREDSTVANFIRQCNHAIASFDWRASSFPKLTDVERRDKQALRGSGGYRVLRIDLLKHLARRSRGVVRATATKALAIVDDE
jgi:DNA-sulfur modification-associated